jgi:hypothetical protein
MLKLKNNACRDHPWRTAAKHSRQCGLCIRQSEMRNRWKKIRQAFRTVERYTRRPTTALDRLVVGKVYLLVIPVEPLLVCGIMGEGDLASSQQLVAHRV